MANIPPKPVLEEMPLMVQDAVAGLTRAVDRLYLQTPEMQDRINHALSGLISNLNFDVSTPGDVVRAASVPAKSGQREI